MKINGLLVPEEAIADVCRRFHIRTLAFFGSVLHGTLRPDSDVDVLVEFEEGHTPGFAFFDIQDELSRLLGRQVDLNTPQFLGPRVRTKVQAEAEVVFAAH
ncbi:MAG: nucleotidyltransferase family protein [Dehalococcoidia bacterium]